MLETAVGLLLTYAGRKAAGVLRRAGSEADAAFDAKVSQLYEWVKVRLLRRQTGRRAFERLEADPEQAEVPRSLSDQLADEAAADPDFAAELERRVARLAAERPETWTVNADIVIKDVTVASEGGLTVFGSKPTVNIDQLVMSATPQGTSLREKRVVSRLLQGFGEVMGREAELDALRAAFARPDRPAGQPERRVLTGLGGIGKTSLARAYALRHRHEYTLVWWIRAETPGLVPAEFRGLLSALEVPETEPVADPVQAAHTVLANRIGRWLLVFDNATDAANLQGSLPAAGDGDILVTTRAGNWPEPGLVLPVSPLPEKVAVRLLTSLSQDPDTEAAREVGDELGGLPLALQQAASYCAVSGCALAAYRDLYRRRQAILLEEGEPPDYDLRVATTWLLSFSQLPAVAQALMNLLAWYAPEAIPLDVLLSGPAPELAYDPEIAHLVQPLHDQVERHRAVAELRRYSLITPADDGFSVHRLVQAVTRHLLAADGEAEAWAVAVTDMLARAVPRPPGTAATLATWKRLQPHVRHHLALTPVPDEPRAHLLRHNLGSWVGESGDAVAARDLYAGLHADRERVLAPEHTLLLLTRQSLAYWTGEAGDPATARDLFAALLPDYQRELGPDHPRTLFTRHQLARWTGKAGEPATARDLFAALLPDCRRILGPDDPNTLATRQELAHFTGEAGEPAVARDLFAALLRERILGQDHPRTLAIRFELAHWTGEAGASAVARDLSAPLVADCERVLGQDHPRTLAARLELAGWTGRAGDPDAARAQLAALVADCERVLGPDHLTTRGTRELLARVRPG